MKSGREPGISKWDREYEAADGDEKRIKRTLHTVLKSGRDRNEEVRFQNKYFEEN